MSAYSAIRDKIEEKIAALAKIGETSGDPSAQFFKYPAAVIIPARQEGDYQTNAENQRIYAFEVLILYETDVNGIENALAALYDLADDVFNTFDTDQQLAGISLPSGYSMVAVRPISAGWETQDTLKLTVLNIKISVWVCYEIS